MLVRKVDKVTHYDKEYIWELVHDQLIKDKFTNTTANIAMLHFESRYEYALNHMNYIHSAEQLAEYVYNGILAEWNQAVRGKKGVG